MTATFTSQSKQTITHSNPEKTVLIRTLKTQTVPISLEPCESGAFVFPYYTKNKKAPQKGASIIKAFVLKLSVFTGNVGRLLSFKGLLDRVCYRIKICVGLSVEIGKKKLTDIGFGFFLWILDRYKNLLGVSQG